MNFIRSLFKFRSTTKVLIGTDQVGNKYYEIAESQRVTGGVLKGRRLYEAQISHDEYKEGSIPMEWEAWVRGNRDNPPTQEEITKREKKTTLIRRRALDLENRDDEKQLQDHKHGLVAKPSQTKSIGHAAAPLYEKVDRSQSSSTGKDYEPASWQPGQSNSKVK